MKRAALTFSFLLTANLLTTSLPLHAQVPIPGALTTAGTTKVDEHGRTWAYVALNPADPALLSGRTLAVFVKPGTPEQPGEFTRAAILRPAADAASIHPLLERADRLNGPGGPRTRSALDQTTAQIWAEARWQDQQVSNPDAPRPEPPFADLPPLADRLAGLIRRADTDTDTAQSLQLLSLTFPAVKQALGLAWAGILPVADGQPATIEIRDWDAAARSSLAVLGRVTLAAANPDPLLPPGTPAQLPEFDAKGDLNIKLRWATPPDLAREGLQIGGYNVWRLTVKAAKDLDVVDGLSPDMILALTADGALAKVNGSSLVLPPKSFTQGDPSQATDVRNFSPPAGDPDTFFLADDNQRYDAGVPAARPFRDGEEFYYFVTACDLLGRDGISSPGGHAIAKRLLPPPTPKGLRVENHHTPGDPRQGFAIFWNEIPADTFLDGSSVDAAQGASSTIVYEVAKGTDLSFLNDPAKREIGLLPPIDFPSLGRQFPYPANGVVDRSLAPADPDYRSTFFFVVRAVKILTTASGIRYELPGPYSPPVMASLHNRHGPPAPTASVSNVYARALVKGSTVKVTDPPQALPFGQYGYRFVCERLDSSVEWAEFFIPSGRNMLSLGRIYFADGQSTAELNLLRPDKLLNVQCQTGGYIGTISRPAYLSPKESHAPDPVPGKIHTFAFIAAEMSPATFWQHHPLAFELSTEEFARTLGPPQPVNDRDAYFYSITYEDPGTEVLVQVDAGGGQWKFLGVDYVTPGFPGQVRYLDPLRASPNHQNRPIRRWIMRAPAVLGESARPMRDEVIVPVRAAADGSAFSPVFIFGTLVAPAREYRIYRQIADGSPSLIKQGTGDPSGNNASFAMSDALLLPPAVPKSYFLQVLDEDGNPSPMTLIYHDPGYGAPPAPRLSEIRSGNDPENPTMIVEWFCEPEGIDRFEIAIQNTYNLSLPAFLQPSRIFTPAGGLNASVASTTTNNTPVTISLNFNTVRQTPRIGGPQFNETSSPLSRNGPRFRAELPVHAGNQYKITVRAVSDRGLTGPFSAAREYTWSPVPSPDDPAIPWPARPLPEIGEFPASGLPETRRISAWQVAYANGASDLIRGGSFGANYVRNDEVIVAVRLGRQTLGGDKDSITRHNRGATLTVQRYDDGGPVPSGNLQGLLFARSGAGQAPSIVPLPAVLYREQIPNDLFPNVSGDVMQVTPMIRQVLQQRITDSSYRLLDPYLALRRITERENQPEAEIFLIDTQPVITGARYRYTLVRFDPVTYEPVESIPCGDLTIQ